MGMDNSNGDSLWKIFEERKLEVQRSKNRWLYWFVGNIVVLFLLASVVFLGFTWGLGFAEASWLEFAVAVPLLYSAIFFHAQHAKAREYLEEYSFKSLSARALMAHRNILREDINRANPDEQKKYLDFVVGVMKDLLLPPRAIISKHPVRQEDDVKVGVVEKLGDVFKKFIPKL